MTLRLTGDDAADELLDREPFALLAGMLLDQQVRMEVAFAGPRRLLDRLGGDRFDAATIAALDPEDLAEAMSRPPAVHRYHGTMATRLHALAQAAVDQLDGDAAQLWHGADDGRDLLRRLTALPGFGPQKARVFVALLGKQVGVAPDGWREAAGEYGEPGVHRSVADVTGPEDVARVRAYKQASRRARSAP